MNNRLVALLLALALTPGAAAASFETGPATVLVDWDEPADCLVDTPLPCAAWYEDQGTPALGDDEVLMYYAVRRAAVHVAAAPTGPQGVVLDVREASVPHGAFQAYSQHYPTVDDARPPWTRVLFHLTMDEAGMHPATLTIHEQTGEIRPWSETWGWDDNFYNYTHLHVPYTTYARSTDYLLEYRSYNQTCPWPWLMGTAGCDVRQARAYFELAQHLLPNVVLGGELHRAEVTLAEATARVAPPAEPGAPAWERPAREGEAGPEPRRDQPRSGPAAPRDLPAAAPPTSGPPGREASSRVAPQALALAAAALPAWWPAAAAVAAAALLLGLGALYHRITCGKALDHPLRRALRAYVAAHPGCDAASIAAHLAVDHKTVTWHLGVLRRAGLVRVSRLGRRALVHLEGHTQAALHAYALRHATRQRVVWRTHTTPGVRLSHLARDLGLSKGTLHAHVTVLVRAGLVVNTRGRLHPAPAGPDPAVLPGGPAAGARKAPGAPAPPAPRPG